MPNILLMQNIMFRYADIKCSHIINFIIMIHVYNKIHIYLDIQYHLYTN